MTTPLLSKSLWSEVDADVNEQQSNIENNLNDDENNQSKVGSKTIETSFVVSDDSSKEEIDKDDISFQLEADDADGTDDSVDFK